MHRAGETTGAEGHLAAGVVRVVAVVRVQGLQEDPVGDGARAAAGLIQHSQDAPVGPLHQVHDGGVVEVYLTSCVSVFPLIIRGE